jgi:hypothetical protein
MLFQTRGAMVRLRRNIQFCMEKKKHKSKMFRHEGKPARDFRKHTTRTGNSHSHRLSPTRITTLIRRDKSGGVGLTLPESPDAKPKSVRAFSFATLIDQQSEFAHSAHTLRSYCLSDIDFVRFRLCRSGVTSVGQARSAAIRRWSITAAGRIHG